MASDPGHLTRWAAAAGLPDHGFPPRAVYGRYLRDTLDDAERQAAPLARVTRLTAGVLAIRPNPAGRPLRVVLDDGCLDADIAILATGNPPPGSPVAVPDTPLWLPALADSRGPVRLGDLLWQVRAAMASRPQRWEEVVDALRPEVPALWRRLPEGDKRLFLRHVARYWEVHRHRMPPATARRVTALRSTGRLSVQAGRVTSVTGQGAGLRVCIEAGGRVTKREAGWLVNATGMHARQRPGSAA